MNYAEDRLDRRAREAGSTHDQLASDLRRAHAVFRRHAPIDLARASAADAPTVQSVRAAHELAGRALRDGGRNREAVFHFGMAWRLCHWLEENNDGSCCNEEGKDEVENEWRACGDYAQMCELAGFPEVGMLALLFYRAGGKLEMEVMVYEGRVDQGMPEGCGCDYAECGASHCFVAFPSHSPVVGDILQALDALAVSPGGSFPTASDILAHLASLTRKADSIEDPVQAMHAFLSERQVMGGVPPILRYWENADTGTDAGSNQRRTLPPVILLLLLKLLYASPVAGPFLQLACISLPYLAARFRTASAEGRGLAREYKSHWAYYVFVRALVLGERVKKHKQGTGIQHTPVWNGVFGLDACRSDEACLAGEEKKEVDERWRTSVYCRRILEACSLTSKQSTSECKATDVAMLRVAPQRIPSYAMHPPIFIVGDSHVLSLAWQTLRIRQDQNTMHRTLTPCPSTGLKAWHTRPSTQFFTHYNLQACLQRLPPTASSIILSAGEIDCREGIGGSLLEGYYQSCDDAVERTVVEYLSALTGLAEKYNLQILVMPIAPHAYRSEKNGKSVGRAKRRETMCLWNEVLRRELANASRKKCERVYLLDYEKRLQHPDTNSPVGYVLHPSYNADWTHVNSAVVSLVVDAILQCGCPLDSL